MERNKKRKKGLYRTNKDAKVGEFNRMPRMSFKVHQATIFTSILLNEM